MINGILMKKLLVLSLVFACLTGEAANKADSVVRTVAGKQVSLDEFVFMEMCIRDRCRGTSFGYRDYCS